MELEKQVSSLELSKTLKTLGVKQESAFYWDTTETCVYPPNRKPENEWRWSLGYGWPRNEGESGRRVISAFTVAELGELLPPYTKSYRYYGGFDCDLENIPSQRTDTEADARAAMLIYLIEKGIVKP